MQKKIFFISGLGADSRAFTLIQEFKGYQNVFLEWVPHQKNDTIVSYTAKLFENQQPNENDVIVGLSFGGLIALEAAKHYSIKKIILLSSFRDKRDLTKLNQFLLNIRAYAIMPNFRINWFDKIALQFFSIKSEEGKKGLLDMMQKTNPKFIKWALKQIRLSYYPNNINIELHNILGTKDKLVALWKLPHNNHYIKNAGHLMVYENADEVNCILEKLL